MKSIFSLIYLYFIFFSVFSQSNTPQNNNSSNTNTSPASPSNTIVTEKTAASNQPGSQATVKTFVTTRNSYINKNDKSISKENQTKLDAMVESMENTNASSFEYNYSMYINQNRSIKAFPFLQKAAEIYPNNENLNKDFIHHYELTNDINKRNSYCKKLHETNTIEAGLMEYNYNVLMSVPKNGILFTYGSDDTYPLFVLQSVKKIRPDVLVLNIEMLSEELYRTNKSSAYGLKIQWKDNIIATSEWIIKNNPSKTLCLGHTVSPKLLQNLKSQLYLTGLTYQFAASPFDNVEILIKNYDLFQIDQLKKTSNYSNIAKLNANYILPLITIMEFYYHSNKKELASQFRSLILKIAQQQGTDFENKINSYITNMGL